MKLNNCNSVVGDSISIQYPKKVELNSLVTLLDSSIALSKLDEEVIEYIDGKTGQTKKVNAVDVSGHRRVLSLADLYTISDSVLSKSGNNQDNDAIGQTWYVTDEKALYELVDWTHRTGPNGWKIEAFSDEDQFDRVYGAGNLFTVDHKEHKYAEIIPATDDEYQYVTVENTSDGLFGKILFTQTGDKKIVLNNIKGEFSLPQRSGDALLITYFNRGGQLYGYSDYVLQSGLYKIPKTITDFVSRYYDSNTIQLAWTAPHGDLISDKVSYYDIRYANSLVDADDAKTWISMKKVSNVPAPLLPGQTHSFTLTLMLPNQEYYLYIKSILIIKGVLYTSLASNFVYCKTLSNKDDSGRPYKIDISDAQIMVSKELVITQSNTGDKSYKSFMIDELSNDKFLDNGYIDNTNNTYLTYWATFNYARGTGQFRVIIELGQVYQIDKLFVGDKRGGLFTLYGIKDIGYPQEVIGINEAGSGFFSIVNGGMKPYRFLIIQYDRIMACGMSNNPVIPLDEYGVPEPFYNYGISNIYRLVVYGKSVSGKPDRILPPVRKTVPKRLMKDFLCTNGHFYQPGTLHAKISGPNVRLYGHPGQFCAFNNAVQLQQFDKISDFKFRLNRIPWVEGNGGTGSYLRENLEKYYRDLGLKPFIVMSGGALDWARLTYKNIVYKECVPCDKHNTYLGPLAPLIKNSLYGFDDRLSVTADPLNYKIMAKLMYALAAVYGKVKHDNASKYVWSSPDYPVAEPMDTGLDLLSGIEVSNEPDKAWLGVMNHHLPEEVMAYLSACYDGHEQKIQDDLGDKSVYGAKNADPNFDIIFPGLASPGGGFLYFILNGKQKRDDKKVPSRCLNTHSYFSNMWLDGGIQEGEYPTTFAVTTEEALDLKNISGKIHKLIFDICHRYAPDTEMWMTEYGYGEAGRRYGKSKLQCYSMAGKMVGQWRIPDVHRSEVKAAWTIRGLMLFLKDGVDQVNLYITHNEGNWFGDQGLEMFRWDELEEGNPGDKYNAIALYESNLDRGGFASFGYFGEYMSNGGYPISRAFWSIALFRTVLGEYEYVGTQKHPIDSRLMIFCFKKRNEEKGAYVIYLNDSQNDGLFGVKIPVPEQNRFATLHNTYIPKLSDPTKIPNTIGMDQKRTGLPTSRREKYINGQWVVQNAVIAGEMESCSQLPAQYPSNPKEGDTVVVLPSAQENPYFPIVGPVCAQKGKTGVLLGSNQFEYYDSSDTLQSKYNNQLTFRLILAVSDYIDYHPEGIHGRNGNQTLMPVLGGNVIMNVTEFPLYLTFDGVPPTTYESYVEDLLVVTNNSTSLTLWWNNTNFNDTDFLIYMSTSPDAGFSILKTIKVGFENKCDVDGLSENTTYYFKVRPMSNGMIGSLSEMASGKTTSYLEKPSSITHVLSTSTTIKISWQYNYNLYPDFLNYSIYRAGSNGIFLFVGSVNDKTITEYTDKDLNVGTYYTYKIRVFGLNGMSEYSDELRVRTLLLTEVSPMPIEQMTDKLGTKIIVRFDLKLLPVGTLNLKDDFILTEGGNVRVVKNVYVDQLNGDRLVLEVNPDSLQDYDKKQRLLLSYNKSADRHILSENGIQVDGFTNIPVINVIGNFTNLYAEYWINMTDTPLNATTNPEWNNWISETPLTAPNLTLKDTYGRQSNIVVSTVYQINKYGFQGVQRDANLAWTGFEDVVQKFAWWVNPNKADITENMMGYMKLQNLDNGRKYTITAYGSIIHGTGSAWKMKINNVYSNMVVQKLATTPIFIEDMSPKQGQLDVFFINAREATSTTLTGNVSCLFINIKEYLSSIDPGIEQLWLRDIKVNEADDLGVLKLQDVTITLNVIGVASHYRVSENIDDLPSKQWILMPAGSTTIPYRVSDGYAKKTIYVLVKNSSVDGNTRSTVVELRDPYEPISLINIHINNDQSTTYNRNVKVVIEKTGSPTHYKLSELSDLSQVLWVAFTGSTNDPIDFLLSDVNGMKTVYCLIKDSLQVSSIKSDTITLEILQVVTKTISVQLSDNQDKSLIRIKTPKLKYNKKLIFSFINDDTNSTYQYQFSAINKRKVAKEFKLPDGRVLVWHLGMEGIQSNEQYVLQQYTPDKFLQYSDGCGIKKRYTSSIAGTMMDNLFPNGVPTTNLGFHFPWVTSDEAILNYDFGNTLMYHDLKDYDTNTITSEQFSQLLAYDKSRFIKYSGFAPKSIAEPNGDHKYITLCLGEKDIHSIVAQGGVPIIQLAYPFKSGFTLDKNSLVILRIFAYGNDSAQDRPQYAVDLMNRLQLMNATTDDSQIYWLIASAHRSSYWETVLIQDIHDLYGDLALDNLWFTTIDEFYDYWFISNSAQISKTDTASGIDITISYNIKDNILFKDMTILVSGIVNPESAVVTGDSSLKCLSSGVNGTDLMINFSDEQKYVDRAEKYVSILEKNNSYKYAKLDAEYFVQLLKPELRVPFLIRIDQMTNPPYLNDVLIPSTTTSRDVLILFVYAGIATHYMISESQTFDGAQWVSVTSGSPVTFTFQLSNTVGQHTLYLKLKNTYGESVAKSSVVSFQPTPVAITSVSINGGAASTEINNVNVSVVYTGAPTHYKVSEQQDMTALPWVEFSSNTLPYTISGTELGVKTVYVKLKDGYNNESAVVSDTIELVAPTPVLTILTFAGSFSGPNVTYYDWNGKTVNLLKQAQANGWQDVLLKNTDGENSMSLIVDSSQYPGSSWKLRSSDIAVENYPAGAIFPHELMLRSTFANGYNIEGLLKFRNIPNGVYKILIYPCMNSSLTPDKYNKCYYDANGVYVYPDFDPKYNANRLITIGDVLVSNGTVDLKFGNTDARDFTGFNVIMFEKTGN